MDFGIFGLQYCHITFISVPVLIAWLTVAVVPLDNFTNVEFTMYSPSLYYMRPIILVEVGVNISSHSTLLHGGKALYYVITCLTWGFQHYFFASGFLPAVSNAWCRILCNDTYLTSLLNPSIYTKKKTHQNLLRSFEDLLIDKDRQRKVTVFL